VLVIHGESSELGESYGVRKERRIWPGVRVVAGQNAFRNGGEAPKLTRHKQSAQGVVLRNGGGVGGVWDCSSTWGGGERRRLREGNAAQNLMRGTSKAKLLDHQRPVAGKGRMAFGEGELMETK